MNYKWGLSVLTAVLVLLAIAGCAGQSPELDGTSWTLIDWTVMGKTPEGIEITAEFSDGLMAGNSGVNRYSGSYSLGKGESFELGQIITTLMAGPEPAMQAEQAYLGLLAQVRTYALADNTLTLYDEAGNEILVFRPVDR